MAHRRDAGERLKKAVGKKAFLNSGLARNLLEASIKARTVEKESPDDTKSVQLLVLKEKSELTDRPSEKGKKGMN